MQGIIAPTTRATRSQRHLAGAAIIVGSVVMAAIFLCSSGSALAQEMHHHHGSPETAENGMAGPHASANAIDNATDNATLKAPPVFIASTAKPFGGLMDDAMVVMDYGMAHAAMDGKPEHDFVTMMMPHHQGAVDMAKAVLLYSNDPEIRNLALGIITEQQNEIRVMQAWLQRHGDKTEK